MKRFKNLRSLARATVVVGAALVVVSGVTYAALQSQNASLQSNTITSASANLSIGASISGLGSSMPGFMFNNIEPGAVATPANDHAFYLGNTGTTNLDIKLAIAPGMSWPASVDVSKVWLQLTAPDNSVKKLSLSALNDSYNQGFTDLGWTLNAGTNGQFKIQALIDSTALTGTTSSLAITNMNLIFSGTSVNAS